jgi:hypothetical protein
MKLIGFEISQLIGENILTTSPGEPGRFGNSKKSRMEITGKSLSETETS